MSSVDDFDTSSQPDFSPVFQSPEGGLIVYRTFRQESCQTVGRPLLKITNAQLKQAIFFRPLCNTRSCPHCAQILARRWVYRAVHGSEVLSTAHKLDFLTVTSHEKLDAAASLAVLPKAWDKLRRRVTRAAETAEYFAVPEQHKNGRWHLHAIITARLSRRWWKDNARQCGLGYQSDVQEVNSLGGVSFYVTKYITKMLQNSNLPKGSKVVRTSHGWPQLPEMPKPAGWTYSVVPSPDALNTEAERYQTIGYTVVIADSASVWDWLDTFGKMDATIQQP